MATQVLTIHWVGYCSLLLFVLAYALVLVEEYTHLRKSKPVILAAGIIWGLIAFKSADQHAAEEVSEALRHALVEYSELLLFLLAAMTYVNALTERNVFAALRAWLVRTGLSARALFWVTGLLAFFLSPVIDNLTTALVLGAVVLALGADNTRFVALGCINVVVAANAGGAFSPFGDITTLMVWQSGHVEFSGFLALFVPSAVNYLVPASLMHFAVPTGQPLPVTTNAAMKRGAIPIMLLFVLTLATAVSFHNFLHLPPFLGMMTGLAYLKFYGYYLKRTSTREYKPSAGVVGDVMPFDIFSQVARAEWDTLLFFYGIILCVGGLGFIGYLDLLAGILYVDWGPTSANVVIGVLSAVIDNIPVMVSVLAMSPDMSHGQWLLITLTAGVGGSMLSIGSAAGVALMGQARGHYTFFRHLLWTPAIALGYAASILTHMWINPL